MCVCVCSCSSLAATDREEEITDENLHRDKGKDLTSRKEEHTLPHTPFFLAV